MPAPLKPFTSDDYIRREYGAAADTLQESAKEIIRKAFAAGRMQGIREADHDAREEARDAYGQGQQDAREAHERERY